MNWSSLCSIYLFLIVELVSSFELSALLLVLAVGNYLLGFLWFVQYSVHLHFTWGNPCYELRTALLASVGEERDKVLIFRSRAGRLSLLLSFLFYCCLVLVTQCSMVRKCQLHGWAIQWEYQFSQQDEILAETSNCLHANLSWSQLVKELEEISSCLFLSVNSLFPSFKIQFSICVFTDTRVNPYLT